MHFKWMILILVAVSCSEERVYVNATPQIGNTLLSYSSNLSNQRNESNYFYNLDETTKKMSLFQKEPFQFVKTLDLDPSFGAKSLFASRDARYALIVGDMTYGIWHEDGRFEWEPVPISGELQSVSYMVMQGSFRSIVFIQFTEDGSIEKSRVMGPMLDSERILSGTLIPGGFLLAGTSEGRLLKVDVESLFSSGEWVYEEISVFEEQTIKWVAHDGRTGGEGHLWIYAGDELRVMDAQTHAVEETFDLKEFQVIGFSSLNIPHMILKSNDRESANTVVLYASSSSGIHKIELDIVTDGASIVDSDGEYLILTNQFRRIRLKDGLVTDSKSIPESVRIVYDDDYYFRIYDSPLGMAEKWEFGKSHALEVISRFYFDEKIE
jgi:hypothetical protein